MDVEEVLAVAEFAAPVLETTETFDLAVVSGQLDQVITWQAVNFVGTAVLIGCLIGAVLAKVIGKLWR